MYTVIRTRVFDDWLAATTGQVHSVSPVVLMGAHGSKARRGSRSRLAGIDSRDNAILNWRGDQASRQLASDRASDSQVTQESRMGSELFKGARTA